MHISIDIKELAISDLQQQDAMLVEQAQHATSLSYSPYSYFAVGAALLLANGMTVEGANQENAAYPVGICAERSALATAQNLYPGVPVVAIALAAREASGELTADYVTPCGMCRQALAETESRYRQPIRVIMASAHKVAVAESVGDLLPLAFA